MKFTLFVVLVSFGWLQAEDEEFPPELRTLQKNYEAAVERATRPITNAYLQELEKLKIEYGRNGQTKHALAVESVVKEITKRPTEAIEEKAVSNHADLSVMSLHQFEDWLSNVVIIEMEGPYKVRFFYDGESVTSMRPDRPDQIRTHESVEIKTGELFVPFTSTNATIKISPSMDSAEVSYDPGGTYHAKIVPKR